MANRYGIPSSPHKVAQILENLSGKTQDPSYLGSQFQNIKSKKSVLREGLQRLLVSDGGCKSNSLIRAQFKVFEDALSQRHSKNNVGSNHLSRVHHEKLKNRFRSVRVGRHTRSNKRPVQPRRSM